MELQTLDVRQDGAIAMIELNRPDKANAMNERMWHEIRDVMHWLDETPSARVGTYVRDHSVADGLNYIATWNAAMLFSDDLDEALRATAERRAPHFAD